MPADIAQALEESEEQPLPLIPSKKRKIILIQGGRYVAVSQDNVNSPLALEVAFVPLLLLK